jgi:L-arabinose isomerase
VGTICEHAEARKLARDLKDTTIGLLPARWEVMTDIYVDEFRLMDQIGPTVQHISVAELASASQGIEVRDVAAFVNDLRDTYEICGVKEETLLVAARASLGLARIADEFSLDALAFNENSAELHRSIGLNPALYVPSLYKGGRVVGMEGDLGTTTSLLILSRLTGRPTMFLEVLSFDQSDSSFIAGHCGQQNVNLAGDNDRVRVVPDLEYENSPETELEGAWMQFMLREGRVTMLQLVCDADDFKMIIAGGESLGGPERIPGFPQAHIRPDVPIAQFFTQLAEAGVTHHLALVHGDVRSELEKLADVLGVRKVVVG